MAMLMMVLLASCGGNPSGTETTDPSTVGTETPEGDSRHSRNRTAGHWGNWLRHRHDRI